MKTAIKILSLALFLLPMTAGETNAQVQEWWTGITYQGALSAGDTKDIADQFSWRNVGIEGRTMVGPKMSVGVFAGWNVFNEETSGTISLAGVDVTGFQSRFVNAIPLLATVHLYSDRRNGPRPYLGGGVGTYWIENRLELGQTALEVDNWHFGLAPEFGIIFPTGGRLEGYLSAKYNYAFESGGITHSYWTFGIGLAGSNRR
jgi:hypothetical protein